MYTLEKFSTKTPSGFGGSFRAVAQRDVLGLWVWFQTDGYCLAVSIKHLRSTHPLTSSAPPLLPQLMMTSSSTHPQKMTKWQKSSNYNVNNNNNINYNNNNNNLNCLTDVRVCFSLSSRRSWVFPGEAVCKYPSCLGLFFFSPEVDDISVCVCVSVRVWAAVQWTKQGEFWLTFSTVELTLLHVHLTPVFLRPLSCLSLSGSAQVLPVKC